MILSLGDVKLQPIARIPGTRRAQGARTRYAATTARLHSERFLIACAASARVPNSRRSRASSSCNSRTRPFADRSVASARARASAHPATGSYFAQNARRARAEVDARSTSSDSPLFSGGGEGGRGGGVYNQSNVTVVVVPAVAFAIFCG